MSKTERDLKEVQNATKNMRANASGFAARALMWTGIAVVGLVKAVKYSRAQGMNEAGVIMGNAVADDLKEKLRDEDD